MTKYRIAGLICHGCGTGDKLEVEYMGQGFVTASCRECVDAEMYSGVAKSAAGAVESWNEHFSESEAS